MDPFVQKINTGVMSSTLDPPNEEGDGEVDEVEFVAMDTSAAATTTTPTAEATSIWDLARQNSSKMVLQSVMDDMEHRAAKQKEELQQFRRRAEDAEACLLSSRQTIERLEASLLDHGETTKGLEKNVREASVETEVLKESIENEKERADRSGAESDRLREEIRYVLGFGSFCFGAATDAVVEKPMLSFCCLLSFNFSINLISLLAVLSPWLDTVLSNGKSVFNR